MKRKHHEFVTALMIVVFLAAVLSAAQATAAPGPWPAKKGELCWVSTSPGPEYSFVRVFVTNMGNDHYLFHGQAYRVDNPANLTKISDLQALGGNIEYDPDTVAWIGQITKTEYISGLLEVYTGLLALDPTTLDGTIEGVISTCQAGSPNINCSMLNTGPIDLALVPCP